MVAPRGPRLDRWALPQLCYTGAAMKHLSAKLSLTEVLLCGWLIAAQIWYVLQFRPLLTFLAARFLHKP